MRTSQFRIVCLFCVCMAGVVAVAGAGLVVVPDVVGKPLDRAEKILEAAGLYVVSVTFEMYEGKPNRVLEQKPRAGREVEVGRGVDLVVSRPLQGSCKNIKVFEPAEGRKWRLGSTHRILWTVGEDCCENVRITLLRNGENVKTIDSSTPNDGEYAWDIPRRLDAGNGYRIRVACDAEHDGISDEFKLKSRN